MGVDQRFFSVKPCGVDDLAAAASARFSGANIGAARDAAALDMAGPGDLTFMNGAPDDAVLERLDGVIVVTTAELATRLPASCAVLECANPRLGFARALALMVEQIADSTASGQNAPDLAPDVVVGEGVYIASGVRVGAGSVIDHGAVIHQGVEIAEGCHIGANAVLSHCRLSDNVVIGANSVIGGSGFGFEITADGPVPLPHVGAVQIGAGTRIAANCAIDRGTLGMTHIGSQVMIDNLVHVAHNCVIEDRAVIAAQVGFAGGVRVGEGAMLAGQAGVSSQVNVGRGAIVMGQSGVTKDVPDGVMVVGFPAEEARGVWRERAALRRLLSASGKKKG